MAANYFKIRTHSQSVLIRAHYGLILWITSSWSDVPFLQLQSPTRQLGRPRVSYRRPIHACRLAVSVGSATNRYVPLSSVYGRRIGSGEWISRKSTELAFNGWWLMILCFVLIVRLTSYQGLYWRSTNNVLMKTINLILNTINDGINGTNSFLVT